MKTQGVLNKLKKKENSLILIFWNAGVINRICRLGMKRVKIDNFIDIMPWYILQYEAEHTRL